MEEEVILRPEDLPHPQDIADSVADEDPEVMTYRLAREAMCQGKRHNAIPEDRDECRHRRAAGWVCQDCGERLARFTHFLDLGGHTLYLKMIDWKEIALPDAGYIYKAYSPSDVIELREYMMYLLWLALDPEEEADKQLPHDVSEKLENYLQTRDQAWELISQRQSPLRVLKFNSTFECGNLERATLVTPQHYVLTVRPDINTCGCSQWFYFSVSNTTADARVQFDIINFTKKSRLYHAGMRVWVLSTKQRGSVSATAADGWMQAGEEISYGGNTHLRKAGGNGAQEDTKHFYTLSFKYTFQFSDDEVFFAYANPYPYTKICRMIAETEVLP